MTGKGTTLVEELDNARLRAGQLCHQLHGTPCAFEDCSLRPEAARLRARAERVREIERGYEQQAFNGSSHGDSILYALRRLIGADLGGVPERERKRYPLAVHRASAIVVCSCGKRWGNAARASLHEDVLAVEHRLLETYVPKMIRHWQLSHEIKLGENAPREFLATIARAAMEARG